MNITYLNKENLMFKYYIFKNYIEKKKKWHNSLIVTAIWSHQHVIQIFHLEFLINILVFDFKTPSTTNFNNIKHLCIQFHLKLLLLPVLRALRAKPFAFWFCCKADTCKMEPLDGALEKRERGRGLDFVQFNRKILILKDILIMFLPLDCRSQSSHRMTLDGINNRLARSDQQAYRARHWDEEFPGWHQPELLQVQQLSILLINGSTIKHNN